VQVLRGPAEAGERGRLPPSAFEEIARLVPELAAKPEAPDEARGLDRPEARFRFYDGVATFLRAASQREPLVVLLDDLHWADSSSLRLLAFLAHEIRESPMLIVGTYRPEDASRGPSPRRSPSWRVGRSTADRLAGWKARGGRAADRAEQADRPRGRARRRDLRARGRQPFFIRELVRMLEAEGRLDEMDGRRAWMSLIPPAVKDVIARRLARSRRRAASCWAPRR
jgi:hypothetical protein